MKSPNIYDETAISREIGKFVPSARALMVRCVQCTQPDTLTNMEGMKTEKNKSEMINVTHYRILGHIFSYSQCTILSDRPGMRWSSVVQRAPPSRPNSYHDLGRRNIFIFFKKSERYKGLFDTENIRLQKIFCFV